ncbi:MAG: hypothetical protein WD751_10385 [Anaerolineales bacterium]
MNEAKASFNGYFRSPGGNKDQFTLRQADNQADKEFVARVQLFVRLLEENGWTEWNGVEGGEQLANGHSGAEAETRNGKTLTRSIEQSSEQRSGQAFEVESIKLAAGGDHPRWVVKGGNFKKFGVTCWPETLEAAGVAEKLDPLKDNKPKGSWTAHYTERQNEEGRWVPDKVTQLVKASK